jgi:DNA oxidative demethylase
MVIKENTGANLFELDLLPQGFRYFADVLTTTEEEELIGQIERLPLTPAVFRGHTAKRRVAHFGVRYSYDARGVSPDAAVPSFLTDVLLRVASLAGENAEVFSEALVTEYQVGATIGWHRDANAFGPAVLGVSLGSACRLRFRRERPGERTMQRASMRLDPRSAYVLTGPARAEWQHSIPAVESLRYSVTFRSVRQPIHGRSR